MPIPLKMRREMDADSYYHRCAITGTTSEKIEWHHNLRYGGTNVQEKFCIIPLAKSIHDKITQYKELCDWIMCNRGTDEELLRYSKVEKYIPMRERLNKKYGKYE